MSFDEQPDEDYKWDIHYHDYSTEHKVRVIAHCKHCARCRFERKNTDCVVLAVAPVADEQPDGDIHADDPASYSAEGEEFPPVPTQLLWMFDGIDRKEATKMMHATLHPQLRGSRLRPCVQHGKEHNRQRIKHVGLRTR